MALDFQALLAEAFKGMGETVTKLNPIILLKDMILNLQEFNLESLDWAHKKSSPLSTSKRVAVNKKTTSIQGVQAFVFQAVHATHVIQKPLAAVYGYVLPGNIYYISSIRSFKKTKGYHLFKAIFQAFHNDAKKQGISFILAETSTNLARILEKQFAFTNWNNDFLIQQT